MRVRKTSVVLVVLWIAGTVLASVAPALLPERFYYDAQTVRDLLADRWPEGSESFVNTARAYRLLGFGSILPDVMVGPIGFAIALAAVAYGASLRKARWQPAVLALLAVWSIPLAIFHGTFSKEIFAIATIAAMLRLAASLPGVLAATALALSYALLFREYWAVIVVLWLVLLFGWRIGLRWPGMLALAIVAIIPLSYLSSSIVGFYLSDGRTVVVDARNDDLNPATIFHNAFVNTSPATDVLNIIICWVTLLLPVRLLMLGGIQHVAFAAFQLVNTAWFARTARALSDPSRRTGGDWRFASAACWCVAYTLVQAMFEPDFGSFVKHESNLVPALMLLLAHRAPRRDAPLVVLERR